MVSDSKSKTTAGKSGGKKVAAGSATASAKTPANKKAAAVGKPAPKKAARPKVAGKAKRPAGEDLSSISMTHEDRWKMIAITAYHKAEARGFTPGGEMQDWLDAEQEVDSLIGR